MEIFHGILFGLTLSVMVGPIFFTVIQTSIEKGFGKAALVAVGVSIGDLALILITYFGFSTVVGFEENEELISYVGSFILLVFGVANILKANKRIEKRKDAEEIKGVFRYIIKGFLINAISPFVPIFWMGTMSIAKVKYGYSGYELVAFFVSIVSVVFITDLIKAHLANKLSKWINDRVIKILNITVGIAFILFAIRMATYSW